jgi:hypothetical protein
MTRDGGQTFTRQAVRNTPDFGLGFPGLRDVSSLSKDFTVIGGLNGFLAVRAADTQAAAGLCTFNSPND